MLELPPGKDFSPSSRKIILFEEVGKTRAGLTRQTIVVASGVFDFVHPDHISHLEEAKTRGDILFVGVASDEIARAKKGEDRPVQNQQARAIVIASLGCVDYVVPMPIAPDGTFLERISPHVWARGIDHSWEDIDPNTRLALITNNISVVSAGGGSSRSTEIIDRIRESR